MNELNGYSSEKPNKKLGVLPHILGLLFGFIGPLIIYVLSNDDFVRKNASEALSWQIFLFIYTIVGLVGFTILFGLLAIPLLLILNIVFSTIASVEASKGRVWSYPFSMNLLMDEKTEDKTKTKPNSTSELSRLSKEEKIKKVKNMYMRGEISESELDSRLDEIMSDETDNETNEKEYSIQYS